MEHYSREQIDLYATNCHKTENHDKTLEQLDRNQRKHPSSTSTSDGDSDLGVLGDTLFRVSYFWYTSIGVIVTMIVGYLVSIVHRWCSKKINGEFPEEVDECLLFRKKDWKSTDHRPNYYNLEEEKLKCDKGFHEID